MGAIKDDYEFVISFYRGGLVGLGVCVGGERKHTESFDGVGYGVELEGFRRSVVEGAVCEGFGLDPV